MNHRMRYTRLVKILCVLVALSGVVAAQGIPGDSPIFAVDTDIPVISLVGQGSITLDCGDPFTDPGATATDPCEGDLTSAVLVGGDTVDLGTPGTYTITYDVTDSSGNAAPQVTRTVMVNDNCADTTPPVARCRNATVTLDAQGNGTLTPADIDAGSSDDAGITSRTVARSSFTCADVGTLGVALVVSDAAGNTASCLAQVTVVEAPICTADTTPPLAICRNVSVTLNENGVATVAAADIDNGSTDNEGIVSRTLSRGGFTCADVGVNTVTLTVADAAGNSASCTATVTVVESGACERAVGTGVLTGVVFDRRTGTPLTCAAVNLMGPTTAVATTNARGEYTATDLPGGTYTLAVFVPGAEIAAGTANVFEGDTRTRNIPIETGTTGGLAIDGVVTQEETGVPLGGVRIDAYSGQTLIATTYTCASGRYGFSFADLGLKQGEVTLLYSAANYEAEQRTVVVQPQGATENVGLTPKVDVSSMLTGIITGSNGPLSGASIKARPVGGVEWETTTAADGSFIFLQLQQGSHNVEASAAGYVTERELVSLRSGSNTWSATLNVDVRPTVTSDAEFREWLGSNFDAADADGDGNLTYTEVTVLVPNVPQPVFDGVDSDRNTMISRAEAGLNTGPICCTGGAKSLWDGFGDLLVIALALGAMLSMRAVKT